MKKLNRDLISELSISDMKAIIDRAKENMEWAEKEISKVERKKKDYSLFKNDANIKKRIKHHNRELEIYEEEFHKNKILFLTTQDYLNRAIENLYDQD
jgi:hypothetical protein